MHRLRFGMRSILIWLCALLCVACHNTSPVPQGPFAEIEVRTLQLINQYRMQQGRPPLEVHPSIYQEAYQHSLNMARGHVGLGHDGFQARVERLRQEFTILGAAENVAYNSSNDPAQMAFNQWRASAGHNSNMLGSYTHTGLAVARSDNGTYYFTQIFLNVRP